MANVIVLEYKTENRPPEFAEFAEFLNLKGMDYNMKRSEINIVLQEMEAFIREHRFELPKFCYFSPEEWRKKGSEYDEIRDNMLGWDVTDWGLGDFYKVGLSLITLRNGNYNTMDKYAKTYAEKLLYLREGQYAPMHFHRKKMEDIINRGGGTVLIKVYNSTPDEGLDLESEVCVHMDGRQSIVSAGTQLRLTPGESITVYPYMYHDFTVEKGTGPVLLGEVSACNDDKTDNRFLENIRRFPVIEEDEPPYRLLCGEYPQDSKTGDGSLSSFGLDPQSPSIVRDKGIPDQVRDDELACH